MYCVNSKSAVALDPAYLYLHLDSSDRNLSSASALILTKSAEIHHYHMQNKELAGKLNLILMLY